jgi:hypothetical protein
VVNVNEYLETESRSKVDNSPKRHEGLTPIGLTNGDRNKDMNLDLNEKLPKQKTTEVTSFSHKREHNMISPNSSYPSQTPM